MTVRGTWVGSLFVVGGLHLVASARWGSSTPSDVDPTTRAPFEVTQSAPPLKYARLPLRFERNDGQLDEAVRFVSRQGGMSLFLTDDGATMALRPPAPDRTSIDDVDDEDVTAESFTPTVLRMRVAGGRDVTPIANDPLVTKSNYFIGDEPSKWRTNVDNFRRVTYPGVLDGVDLVFHGKDGKLEYDFVVAPGVDPASVAMEVEGADGLSLTANGDLAIATARGTLVQPKPRVYQHDGRGAEVDVPSAYRLVGERSIGFEIASYDPTRDLVIDPVIAFATFLGGTSSENVQNIVRDDAGNIYVSGVTESGDFPTTPGVNQPTQPPTESTSLSDVFVAKLNAEATDVLYATYLGGRDSDLNSAIAVDALGRVHVVGSTSSTNFPLVGAVKTSLTGTRDAFISKLDATGSALLYSTYLGGSGTDYGYALSLDGDGHAYVAGSTTSTNFPVSADAMKSTLSGSSDGYLVKLNPAGDTIVYGTYFGGSGSESANALAVDAAGHVYLAGSTGSTDFSTTVGAYQTTFGGGTNDGFVAKLDPETAQILYATYLGGSGNEGLGHLVVDDAGRAYVAMSTSSATVPTTTGAFRTTHSGLNEGYVAALNATGSTLSFGTYFGGTGNDTVLGLAVNSRGHVYFAGRSASANLPTTPNALQTTRDGSGDGYVAKLSPDGTKLLYASYLGGAGNDQVSALLLHDDDQLYFCGFTTSTDFPVEGTAAQPEHASRDDAIDDIAPESDGFVAKLIIPMLTLSPAPTSIPPLTTITFVATGGSGAGYVFSLDAAASGGAINAATGVYVAGAISGTDVVKVTDANGETFALDVAVGGGLVIDPATSTVAPGATISFSVSGGAGTGYAWQLRENTSGGAIDANTGVYVAGATEGVDTVLATDSLGNTDTATVTVTTTPDRSDPNQPDTELPPPEPAQDEASTASKDESGGCGVAQHTHRDGVLGLGMGILALGFTVARRARRARLHSSLDDKTPPRSR